MPDDTRFPKLKEAREEFAEKKAAYDAASQALSQANRKLQDAREAKALPTSLLDLQHIVQEASARQQDASRALDMAKHHVAMAERTEAERLRLRIIEEYEAAARRLGVLASELIECDARLNMPPRCLALQRLAVPAFDKGERFCGDSNGLVLSAYDLDRFRAEAVKALDARSAE